MAFQFRKLLPDDSDSTTAVKGTICSPQCSSSDDDPNYCTSLCFNYCQENCPARLPPHHTKLGKLLITGLVLASVFCLVLCCAICYRYYSRSRIRRRSLLHAQDQRNDETTTTHEEQFLDEDHGPAVVDHHIWYINTIGLQPSVINSISVVKYKRGDGLVEGTDCSVCLNEFQDDETLKLLPKCSHAFHVPCIDTWLRSHTNCPMCRAPILANSARATTSGEGSSGSVSSGDETRIEVSENDQVSERELEGGGDGELRVGVQEERELEDENRILNVEEDEEEKDEEKGMQPIRRSVSLDSLSAFKISQALANVCVLECDRNSRTGLVKESVSNMEIVPKRVGSNQSLLKFMASSSIGRSLQSGPSSLKRSFSCGGKLFLSRYSSSRNSSSSNSVLPLSR